MICCKIVTNFNDESSDFSKLLSKLSEIGEFMWNNNSLYFGDVTGNVDNKKIKSILKKCGFKEFYINEYNKDNNPHESDEINAWILDKCIKINYKMIEDQSQELFRNISKGLDILDEEIENIKNKEAISSDVSDN